MTTSISPLIPSLALRNDFAPQSKIWVYIAARELSDPETRMAQAALDLFVESWTAHNQALQACAEIVQNRFILLMVDETGAGASGCSIDKSVHFLENLSRELGVDLFDRMQFAWVEGDTIRVANRETFSLQLQNGAITPDTPVVNTLVQTKEELATRWLIPFGESWYKRVV